LKENDTSLITEAFNQVNQKDTYAKQFTQAL